MLDSFYLVVSIWILFSDLSSCVLVLHFVISNFPWYFLQYVWNCLKFWWLSIECRYFFWWTSFEWKLWCHMTRVLVISSLTMRRPTHVSVTAFFVFTLFSDICSLVSDFSVIFSNAAIRLFIFGWTSSSCFQFPFPFCCSFVLCLLFSLNSCVSIFWMDTFIINIWLNITKFFITIDKSSKQK